MRKHYSPAGEAFQINLLNLIFSAQGATPEQQLRFRGCLSWFSASTSQGQSCGAKPSYISRSTKSDQSGLTKGVGEECPLGHMVLRMRRHCIAAKARAFFLCVLFVTAVPQSVQIADCYNGSCLLRTTAFTLSVRASNT